MTAASDHELVIHELITQRSEARRRGAFDVADGLKRRLHEEFGIDKLSDNVDFSTTFETVDCNTGSVDSETKPITVPVLKKSTVSGRRRKAMKKNERKVDTKGRGIAFATFLLDTFGVEMLRKGSVVDVAGGRGDTSWELALKWNIQCCIIDPLGLRLSQHRQKIVLCRSCGAGTDTSTSGAVASNLIVSDFDSVPIDNGTAMIETVQRGEGDGESNQAVDMVALERCLGITQQCRLFVPADACDDLIKNCSLLAGLHADEATELIVDAALEAGKPFAIVPCCVFPTLFPHRYLPSGEQVRSLESFLIYLQNKHPDIKRCIVPNLLSPTNTALYKFA